MFYKRKGLPEVDEIVLCKVTKIFPNSVFVDLPEFDDSGMVHISEVSPGRIRNLRDYVSIGRQIVCKVLRIDREKGHIDLSLRRVNTHQRRDKLDEIKQELKAESLILNLAKKLKQPELELYKKITEQVFKEYSHLYLCFWDIVAGEVDLEKLGLEKSLAAELRQAILDKFKPQKIKINGEIKLRTYSPDGIEKIKKALQKIEQVSANLTLFYLGAGRYRLAVEDVDYGPAEENLEKVEEILEEFNDKLSTASFEREKND
ncbi:MAG TPA: S1 RNA-binding domain-containing protein [Candidatus Nanoarchaeia archaeon]|nr:S1 RNA-binding domain-containing protein [Candidatus Nanoarchaeia archaeon]